MQPLTPEEKTEILKRDPSLEKDLEEYEGLLATQFTCDPSQNQEGADRLNDLHRKLFPSPNAPRTQRRQLNERQARKIRTEDRQTFEDADDSDVLVVIMNLRSASPNVEEDIDPKDYATREDWRKALIQRRIDHFQIAFKETIDVLRSLSLDVRGGIFSNTVVKGTVANILLALELPLVGKITLNRSFDLIQPKRGG